MRRYYRRKVVAKTLAIGIKGDLSSLCGAIKRFQRRGRQWNGLLTLKEQCARRIALLKKEQLKCFITAYLPPNLFKYVTKDIFNLQGSQFTSNYAKPFYMCGDCTMDTDTESGTTCRCPDLQAAIYKLNKHFVKRINMGNKTKTNQLKTFELIYKAPNAEDIYLNEGKSISFFLYLSPCEYHDEIEIDVNNDDMDSVAYQSHQFINSQVSVEEKLLFVDVMRFFGGFQTYKEQPQLILSERCDIDRE